MTHSNRTEYYAFVAKGTGELIAVVNLYRWSNASQRFTHEMGAMAFLNAVYEIKLITNTEKEIYCDAFDAVPVYDITDLGVLVINWYLGGDHYWGFNQ